MAFSCLLVGASAHAECTKDVDCEGEQICEDGRCVEAPPPAQSAAPSSPLGAKPSPRLGPPRVILIDTPKVPDAPRFERRSPALVIGGSLLIAAGLGGLVVGLGSMGRTCHYELADDFKVEHCESSPNYWAYALGGGASSAGSC